MTNVILGIKFATTYITTLLIFDWKECFERVLTQGSISCNPPTFGVKEREDSEGAKILIL